MKAARFHARKDIRIEDIPEPELRAGAVKIDVAWCGICGTDLHEYLEGPIFCPAPGHPHPLSHEDSPVTLGQTTPTFPASTPCRMMASHLRTLTGR